MKKLVLAGLIFASLGMLGGCATTKGAETPTDETFEEYHDIDYMNIEPGRTARSRKRFNISKNVGEYELKSMKVSYLPVGASFEFDDEDEPNEYADLVEFLIFENEEYDDAELGVTGKLVINADGSCQRAMTYKSDPTDTSIDEDYLITDVNHNRPILKTDMYGYNYYFKDSKTVYEVMLGSSGEGSESDIWAIQKYVRVK